ncbi:hypothetical protein BHE90_004531 [Fusarium euwallaceae]|uniref:Uncharacterized protein n=2 Tax=Fusarium solani species complex TaxID=232080 RepID=A0A3M2SAK1_9HYPO|nr:hypothetical protein CDV36_005766 [Fusarium kuroshium]RTE80968.1 hypothetical protein BHE90_004531 [Fusarium euwallaceae]
MPDKIRQQAMLLVQLKEVCYGLQGEYEVVNVMSQALHAVECHVHVRVAFTQGNQRTTVLSFSHATTIS